MDGVAAYEMAEQLRGQARECRWLFCSIRETGEFKGIFEI